LYVHIRYTSETAALRNDLAKVLKIFHPDAMKRLFVLLFILVLFAPLSLITEAAPSSDREYELQYQALLRQADYPALVEHAASWLHETEDPLVTRLIILRLEELSSFPELSGKIRDALEEYLLKKPERDTLNYLRARDCIGSLRPGKMPSSGETHSPVIIQPVFFSMDVEGFPKGGALPTDDHSVLRLERFLDRVENRPYTIEGKFDIPEEGNRVISLGTTGPLEVRLDGNVIFRQDHHHGFHRDQYQVKVHLDKGSHSLLFKTAGREGSCKLSARLFPAPEETPAPDKGEPWKVFVRLHTDHLLGLTSGEGPGEPYREITQSPFRETALWLLSRTLETAEERWILLEEVLEREPNHVPALHDLALLYIDHERFTRTGKVLERIHDLKGRSPLWLDGMFRLFLARKWYPGAGEYGRELLKSPLPSLGHRALYDLYRQRQQYFLAFAHLLPKNSPEGLTEYAESALKAGERNRAREILLRGIHLYPDSTSLRLDLAELDRERRLSVLSSTLTVNPNNGYTLYSLGRYYAGREKTDLARYYLSGARNRLPESTAITRHLDLVTEKDDIIDRFLLPVETGLSGEAGHHSQATILFRERVLHITSTGSQHRHVREITRINRRGGGDSFKHLVFIPGQDRISRLKCVVHRGDKTTRITEFFQQSLSDPEERLYYDARALIIPLPSLGPGDVVDFSYRIERTPHYEERHLTGERFLLGDNIPVKRERIVIIHPESRNMHISFTGKSWPLAGKVSGNKRVKILDTKELPRFPEEPSSPPMEDLLPSLHVTSFTSWKEAGAWYSRLSEPRIRMTPEIRKQVKEIMESTSDEEERVRQIYRYVCDNIRYVGLEMGIGGLRPRRTDEVFQSGMGDCKDVSLLLAAMLREAGLDARLVLIRTADRGRCHSSVPDLGQFNHAICYARGKRKYLLDATLSRAGIDERPSSIQGRCMLLVDRHRSRIITDREIPVVPEKTAADTTLFLKEDGSVRMKRTLTFHGSRAAETRESFLNPEKKKKELETYWNRRFPGSRIRELSHGSLEPGKPVTYTYGIDIPSFATIMDGDMVLPAHPVTTDLADGSAILLERRTPLEMGLSSNIVTTCTFVPPEGYIPVRVPGDRIIEHSSFRYEGKYHVRDESRVICNGEIQFKPAHIPVNAYPSFRKKSVELYRHEQSTLIFRRKPGDSREQGG
jgi:tetratricopeptide (TPR) repeat protein